MPEAAGAVKGHTPFSMDGLVVALSFTDLALLCGVWYGFSAFVLAFSREFGWSRASISGVFALNMALYGFSGPAVGFSMAADLFQGKHLEAVMGILGLGIGLGCSVGPWMAGWLYDLSRSYHLAFGLAGVATVLSCAGAWLAAPGKIRGIGRRVGALS